MDLGARKTSPAAAARMASAQLLGARDRRQQAGRALAEPFVGDGLVKPVADEDQPRRHALHRDEVEDAIAVEVAQGGPSTATSGANARTRSSAPAPPSPRRRWRRRILRTARPIASPKSGSPLAITTRTARVRRGPPNGCSTCLSLSKVIASLLEASWVASTDRVTNLNVSRRVVRSAARARRSADPGVPRRPIARTMAAPAAGAEPERHGHHPDRRAAADPRRHRAAAHRCARTRRGAPQRRLHRSTS